MIRLTIFLASLICSISALANSANFNIGDSRLFLNVDNFLEYSIQYNLTDHSKEPVYGWVKPTVVDAKSNISLKWLHSGALRNSITRAFISLDRRWEDYIEQAFIRHTFMSKHSLSYGIMDIYSMQFSLKRNAFDNGFSILPQGTNRYTLRSGFTTMLGFKYQFDNKLSLKYIPEFKYSFEFGYGKPYILLQRDMDLSAFGSEDPFTKVEGDSLRHFVLKIYAGRFTYQTKFTKFIMHFEEEKQPGMLDFVLIPPNRQSWWLWMNPDYKRGTTWLWRHYLGWKERDHEFSLEWYNVNFQNNLISPGGEEGSEGATFVYRRFFDTYDIYTGYGTSQTKREGSFRHREMFIGGNVILNENLYLTMQFTRFAGDSWLIQDNIIHPKEDHPRDQYHNIISATISYHF